MKGNFKTLLRKFCLESTVLGLKYFFLYPDRLSRCFWCVTMLAVACLSVVLTQRLYYRFAEMPTRITIENQYEYINNLPYPSITLCSPNQITSSYIETLLPLLGNAKSTLEVHDLLGLYEIFDVVKSETGLEDLQSELDRINITVPQLIGYIAQSCESFLKLCYFEMNPYINCKNLLVPIITAQGLCCTFNNNYYFNGKTNLHNPDAETRTVQTTGESRGLVVVGDYSPDDAIPGTVLSGGAVKVMITDASEFPTSREMTVVESNTESFHIMNAAYTYCSEEVMTLAPEHRRCYLEDEFELPYFKTYSRSDCELMCVVKTIENECDCIMFYVANVSTPRLCNLTDMTCIMRVKSFSKSMYKCGCLSDCESRQYSADIILGNLDAMPYMLQNLYEGIQFNKSTFIMNFYFANAMYVKKKQETVMSLAILASNLGGIFGLCLGCSCISVLEILFYLYKAVRNYHNTSQRERSLVHFIEFRN